MTVGEPGLFRPRSRRGIAAVAGMLAAAACVQPPEKLPWPGSTNSRHFALYGSTGGSCDDLNSERWDRIAIRPGEWGHGYLAALHRYRSQSGPNGTPISAEEISARVSQYCAAYADRYATILDGAYHTALNLRAGDYPAPTDIPECAGYLALWTRSGDGPPRARPEMRDRGYRIQVWQSGYLGGYGEQMERQGLRNVSIASYLNLRMYQYCDAHPRANLQDAMDAYLRNYERFWRQESASGNDLPPARPIIAGEIQPEPWAPPPPGWASGSP